MTVQAQNDLDFSPVLRLSPEPISHWPAWKMVWGDHELTTEARLGLLRYAFEAPVGSRSRHLSPTEATDRIRFFLCWSNGWWRPKHQFELDTDLSIGRPADANLPAIRQKIAQYAFEQLSRCVFKAANATPKYLANLLDDAPDDFVRFFHLTSGPKLRVANVGFEPRSAHAQQAETFARTMARYGLGLYDIADHRVPQALLMNHAGTLIEILAALGSLDDLIRIDYERYMTEDAWRTLRALAFERDGRWLRRETPYATCAQAIQDGSKAAIVYHAVSCRAGRPAR